MKKAILSALLISLFVLPAMSDSSMATASELIDYDTGVKVEGYETTVTISWKIGGCMAIAERANVEIEYRSTSPPKARPGWFDLSGLVIDRTWEDGVWYGSATFVSHINPAADRGTNHGDITIWWWNPSEPVFSWSFNVQHTN